MTEAVGAFAAAVLAGAAAFLAGAAFAAAAGAFAGAAAFGATFLGVAAFAIVFTLFRLFVSHAIRWKVGDLPGIAPRAPRRPK
ncbi:MAG: hypothetical protein E5W82_12765 [Mesorhizobium sp.]|nr:MAG: hypothetical protein E5W91_08320 [Mesorhizobium sp.]TIS87114.1 MAG: hypothetical protein E5W89_26145 [Mesorhizobium sp.]TJW13542.1 MAG: hypothetical protein E5W82_12765 [Mesorhizobium sp.]